MRAGRSTATRPRATSGLVSSDDVVVSVKRAVSVFIESLSRLPFAYSSSNESAPAACGDAFSVCADGDAAYHVHAAASAAIACAVRRRAGTLIAAMVTYGACA